MKCELCSDDILDGEGIACSVCLAGLEQDRAELATLRAEVKALRAILEDRSIRGRLLLDGRSGYVLVDRNGYAPIDSVLYPTPREAIDAAIKTVEVEE